jgi:xanthine dehydrogenase accessory factor
VEEGSLQRIDVPAGIPIGSRTGPEIALSILAKVVSVRRGESDDPAASPRPPAAAGSVPSPAVDPICGMTVAAVESTLSLERDGATIYFCGEGCRDRFKAEEEHASVSS